VNHEAISVKYVVIRHANVIFSAAHYLLSSVACQGTTIFCHIISWTARLSENLYWI